MISLLPYQHWQGDLPVSEMSLEGFLCARFHHPSCVVTPRGRVALALVLQQLRLEPWDEVYITTTFDYPNVSSCVTSTVFNICKPARVLSDQTRAILVIHEFGVPHDSLMELRELADSRGIPLIEDCAHTLDSWQGNVLVGSVGDYAICSFSKIFPVAYGGALLGPGVAYAPSQVDRQYIALVHDRVTPHLARLEEYSQRRRHVFKKLTHHCGELGLAPLFRASDSISPWSFPVPTPRWQECLELAPEMGVECGLWHGTNIVIFPCHQYLTDDCVARTTRVIEAALEM